jgi:type VI secretion system protein ImpE
MTSKELFDAGNLRGAIDAVTQEVKASPRDLRSRVFLFELLSFAGEFQRAERQLDTIAQTSGDVKVELGIELYRNVLKAETARSGFFLGENRQPTFLSEPPAYTVLHVEAISKFRQEKVDEIDDLLNESNRIRKRSAGQRAGNRFEDIRDGDDLVGPFLEVVYQREYVWLPFEQIRNLDIQAPRTLRDLLWIPAKIDLTDKPLGDVFVPVQYYGSSQHSNDQVKLGRMTDWKPLGEQGFVGAGQRTLFIDETEYPLLETGRIEFAVSA